MKEALPAIILFFLLFLIANSGAITTPYIWIPNTDADTIMRFVGVNPDSFSTQDAPHGVAVDVDRNRAYVASQHYNYPNNYCILDVFDLDGAAIRSIDTGGLTPCSNPAIDQNGNVFFAYESYVSKYDFSGNMIGIWVISDYTNTPAELFVDANGNPWITTGWSAVVVKLDGNNSDVILGAYNAGGFFTNTIGIAIDLNRVIVADYEQAKIFDLNYSGVKKNTYNLTSPPWGVKIDGSRNIIYSKTFENKVGKITPDGTKTEYDTCTSPTGLGIDETYVYVDCSGGDIYKHLLSNLSNWTVISQTPSDTGTSSGDFTGFQYQAFTQGCINPINFSETNPKINCSCNYSIDKNQAIDGNITTYGKGTLTLNAKLAFTNEHASFDIAPNCKLEITSKGEIE